MRYSSVERAGRRARLREGPGERAEYATRTVGIAECARPLRAPVCLAQWLMHDAMRKVISRPRESPMETAIPHKGSVERAGASSPAEKLRGLGGAVRESTRGELRSA